MGKMIQADTFHGQKMFLNWKGYHSAANTNYTLYDTGMTTNSPYAYQTIIPPFKGCVNKVSIVNNPYSSYNTGPTGYEAILQVYINGSLSETKYSYYGNNAGEVVSFDFLETATFNANDKVVLRFQANGVWRYCNTGIQLTELA
tara:strand:+ start:204 stop:635 length:432 start_codon:yes stop_codon:yes gene_type:complete